MDDDFAFNGRMMAILGAVLVLLMAVCFGLGMLYADYRGAPAVAKAAAPAAKADKSEVKEQAK